MEGRRCRVKGSKERKMSRTLDLGNISTRIQRIGRVAEEKPDLVFTSLAHNIDLYWLWEALHQVRRDGASGLDGQTWKAYRSEADNKLKELLEAFKSGSYRAPNLKRSYIPKPDGTKRPIAIANVEDKVLQKAVAMVLEAVYEQDFYDFSYGFRPGRSPHLAVKHVRDTLQNWGGAWVIEADIKSFFDAIDHQKLKEILDLRVKDGVMRRTIHKWLKAGVMDQGKLLKPERGTPQGGVISPLLANIFLHEVLDNWFVKEVMPRIQGKAEIVRFADDYIILCEAERDAQRIMEVLPKRFEKFGLTLHPDKTRMIDFRKPKEGERKPTFDFLGFTFYWGFSKKWKNWYVKKRTSKKKFQKSLAAFTEKIKANRHQKLPQQHQRICRGLKGYYGYYGTKGNYEKLAVFLHKVTRIWHKWLNRRAQKRTLTWEKFRGILNKYPLPAPRIVHKNI